MRQIILRLVVALLTLSVGTALSFAWKAFSPSEVQIQPPVAQTVLVTRTNIAPQCSAADNNPPLATHTPTIRGYVLNGRALSKPAPPYPAIARTARAQGAVMVQILVDEEGRVLSACAASGHPLLQQAAVQAAYQARFSPTLLSGQPVRVSGVITYNFVLE